MSFIASDPGLQVDDPGTTPVRREVPVDPNDRKQGSFTLLLRPVPAGKWRALVREHTTVYRRVAALGGLIDRIRAEVPQDIAGVETQVLRLAELDAALEAANVEQERCLSAFVAWGCAGHEGIVTDKGVSFPVVLSRVAWLGKEWETLHADTLALYGRLNISGLVLGYVTRFQGRNLPETLEGFWPDPTKGSPAP